MNFHYKILFFGFLIYLNLSNAKLSEEPQNAFDRVSSRIAALGRRMFYYLEIASGPSENLLFSPTNIYHAVALLHMAARGFTLKEISEQMGIPPTSNYSKTFIHSELSSFYKNITTSDQDPVIINIADALFLRDGFQIKKDYLDNATRLYQTQIENVDFAAGKGAPGKINKWVSDKTRGRISQVVKDDLDKSTEALMISTLYFNARWYQPFDKLGTKKDTFFTGEKQVDVQMMHLTENLPYVNNVEHQFESIDLQYDGTYDAEYALNIILPYPNQTIKNFVDKLEHISIDQIMKNETVVGVDVKLPKIKIRITQSLIPVFEFIGIRQIFIGGSKLTDLHDLTENTVAVSKIEHGAEIEINEEGTIATAVTPGHVIETSAPGPIVKPIPFHVNRPFILHIYKRGTPLTMFSGIVYKPESKS